MNAPVGVAPNVWVSSIEENSLQEVAAFLIPEAGYPPGSEASLYAWLRWYLLRNPAYDKKFPLGWALRDEASRIVGTLLCTPQRFCHQGILYDFLVCGWLHVAESYRGRGLGRLLYSQYFEHGNEHVLLGTSANAQGMAVAKQFGARPIPDTNYELTGVIRWRPVLQQRMGRKLGQGKMTRSAAAFLAVFADQMWPINTHRSPGKLLALRSPEEAAPLKLEPPREKIAGLRDPDFIRWRYFTSPDPTTALFAFQHPRQDRDSLVAVNETRRGYFRTTRTLNVLDLSPRLDPDLLGDLCSLLVEQYRKRIDTVMFRCLLPEQRRSLARMGFWERDLGTSQAYWIDRSARLPSAEWYLTPADGDLLVS